MLATLAIVLLATSAVSAGPHGRYTSYHIRRRHARRVHDPKAESMFKLVYNARRADCQDGAWQCDGSTLQHCDHGSWLNVQNCTGDNIVCSADSRATGCIWSWSLQQGNPVTVTATSTATSVQPTATSAESDDDCDDDDETAFSSVNSTATSSLGGALIAGGPPTTTTKKHESTSTRDWYRQSTAAASDSWSSSAIAYASSAARSASSSSPAWLTSSTSAWSPSSSADWGDSSSIAAASTTRSWYGQTTATASTTTRRGKGRKTSTARSSSAYGTGSATDSAHASASATATGSVSTGNGTTNRGNNSFSAPHYVIYSDENLSAMPSASDLSSYNRFILAFWMTGSGATDNARFWEGLDASTRSSTVEEYHNAGIALMVSAFGSTDTPTSSGVDPTTCAQQLASWVKKYGMDGVDIDYEDMDAMNGGTAEAWIITFQKELRSLLPNYIISHAPVAPWFTSGNSYSNGAYVKIHQEAGSGIDWYNVQFYNQGSSAYTTCETLITDSGSSWPDTSVMGIHSNTGMALDKIVIGKPLDSGAASNGYMDGSTLNSCVTLAKSKGWNAGVMFWEWQASVSCPLKVDTSS